jgi:hypothetical protein
MARLILRKDAQPPAVSMAATVKCEAAAMDPPKSAPPAPIDSIALAYLARGWSVVPIRAGSKQPLVRWQAYQEERPGVDEVRAWYRRWPDAGVGIVTGAVSNLVVLDIDVGHGGDESLAELERRNGALPNTVEAITGGGGRHLYFGHPSGNVPSRVGLAPGIDLRADGGLVVAPPSLHPSGRRYRWEVSHHPDETAVAAMPHWLSRLIQQDRPRLGHPVSHWRDLVRHGVGQGARNNSVASLTGHLLWHGIDPDVALDLLLCWNRVRCRPPLSDEEVAAAVESIHRTHDRHAAEPSPPKA